MAQVSSLIILWFNSRRSNDPSGFGNCTMCFVFTLLHDCSLEAGRWLRLRSDGNTVRRRGASFRLLSRKDDLGWHHCKIGPEDDRSTYADFGIRSCGYSRSNAMPTKRRIWLGDVADGCRISLRRGRAPLDAW